MWFDTGTGQRRLRPLPRLALPRCAKPTAAPVRGSLRAAEPKHREDHNPPEVTAL